jgi:hypothetical protein
LGAEYQEVTVEKATIRARVIADLSLVAQDLITLRTSPPAVVSLAVVLRDGSPIGSAIGVGVSSYILSLWHRIAELKARTGRPMAKSGPERQQAYGERLERSGLVHVPFWVGKRDQAAIRAAARRAGLSVGEWMLGACAPPAAGRQAVCRRARAGRAVAR